MRFLFLITLIVPALICCDKNKNEPKAETADLLTGTIYGKVTHHDNDGAEYFRGLNKTKIMLDGVTSVMADSLGNYILKDVPVGNYSMTFLKDGTGLIRKYDVVLNGNDQVKIDVALADTAAWIISGAEITDSLINNEPFMVFTFTVPVVDQQRYVQVYFGDKKTLSAKTPSSFQETATFILPIQQAICTFPFSYAHLQDKGLKKGSTAFVKCYPVNPNCLYWDAPSKQTICSGTGSPYPTFTVTVP